MADIENSWKPRGEVVLDCPSGSRCAVQRPGTELVLTTSRLQRTLRSVRAVSTEAEQEDWTEEERERAAAEALDRMTPEQRVASLDVMRHTVAACVRRPRIYVDPGPGQVGVDDIPAEDFLFIWKWYTDGCPDVPVETEEGSATAEAVDNFSAEPPRGAGTGDHGGLVRPEAVGAAGA